MKWRIYQKKPERRGPAAGSTTTGLTGRCRVPRPEAQRGSRPPHRRACRGPQPEGHPPGPLAPGSRHWRPPSGTGWPDRPPRRRATAARGAPRRLRGRAPRPRQHPEHIAATMRHLRRILVDELKARHWQDVEPSRVMTAVAALKRGSRPVAAGTKNDYLRDLKGFARWCVRNRRMAESPLEHLRRLDAAKVGRIAGTRAGRSRSRRPVRCSRPPPPGRAVRHGPEGPKPPLPACDRERAPRKELRNLCKQNVDLEPTP